MDESTPAESPEPTDTPDVDEHTSEKPLSFSEDQPEPPKKNKTDLNEPHLSEPPNEPRGSRWLLFIIIIVFLVLIGGAVWLLVLRDDSSDSSTADSDQANSQEIVEEALPVPEYDLEQVIYGFGVSFESAADIFARPAGGGDRESLYGLDSVTSIDFTTLGDQAGFVVSEKFAFVVDNTEIYIGDVDVAPELIYTHPEGDPDEATGVQNVIISPDGTQLAFTAITVDTSTPQVWTVSAGGGEARLLVDDAKIGPLQWSHDNSKLLFGPNILGAGAQLETPYALDIESNQKTPIGDDESPYAYLVYAYSLDGTKVAYVRPTIDQNRATDDVVGFYVGKPYTIAWRDLTTGEETIVATVENDPMPRSIFWTFKGDYFYFSIGNALYDSSSLETGVDPLESPAYETTTSEDIDIIYAVNSRGTLALIGSLQEDNTYTVYAVDLMGLDRTEIMQTTDATTPIGILVQ